MASTTPVPSEYIPYLTSGVADLLPAPDPTVVLGKLDDVQREMDTLRSELGLLRKRDDTLNFFMQRLDEELRLAAKLQQDFLPKTLPTLGPARFHALWRPAGYVSGDLYDVMRLDEKHVGFYMADAVGHGMPAALLTMFVKHALVTKDITPDGYRLLTPGEALVRLNHAMLEQNLSQANFATAVYGVLNVETLVLNLAKAGHPAPLLFRDGSPQPLTPDGCLLGIFSDEPFETQTIQLKPADRILVFTDGLEVAYDEDATAKGHSHATEDPPPAPRWKRELVARQSLPPQQLLSDLSADLDQQTGSLDPRDDVAVMVVEVLP